MHVKSQYRVNLKDLQATGRLGKRPFAGWNGPYSCPRSFKLITSSMVVVAAAACR